MGCVLMFVRALMNAVVLYTKDKAQDVKFAYLKIPRLAMYVREHMNTLVLDTKPSINTPDR